MNTTNHYSKYQVASLVIALVLITIVFFAMIRQFLVALFLAAIFSAFSAPLYRRLLKFSGNRSGFATALTLLVLFTGVLTPTIWIIYIAAEQAAILSDSIVGLIQRIEANEYTLRAPEWLPYSDDLESVGAQIVAKVGELVGGMARYLVTAASAATRGTASFFLSLFVMTYAMTFFLRKDTNIVAWLLTFTGLPPETQQRLSTTVISVSGATLRGTVVISVIQGLLAGLGFAVAGVEGAAFWGVLVALVSMLPGIGPTLIWVPVVLYVYLDGDTGAAIGLAIWCTIIVSTIDNVLRPQLVGQDAQMSGLLVLISTLGGISMFGVVGFIIGPVIAGLLIAIWEISAEVLADRSAGAVT